MQEGDGSLLVKVVPNKPSKAPGKIKVNFEELGKAREEQEKKKSEDEKQRRYEKHRRSFGEAKRRSQHPEVSYPSRRAVRHVELSHFVCGGGAICPQVIHA